MLNTFQKTTKSGKGIINTMTKLPEFTLSVHTRIRKVQEQLGYTNYKPNFEQRWNSICQEASLFQA